jgi:two-component system CheB/CheR fusion protein
MMAKKTKKQPKQSKKNTSQQSQKTTEAKLPKSVPIIGIGASAGGLEALEGLCANMPADINAALVVIQHLDPHHKSLMGELLQPYAKLKVMQIEDGQVPEKNCIYINLPNFKVGLMASTFCLVAADKSQSAGLPIDHFFRTMADDLKERAIAIVLSGTGTDGSLGIKAVKGQGGLAIVQEEAQAAYSGMPSSAIETGLVDMVLPVEKIGPELCQYLEHSYIAEHKKPAVDDSFNQFLKKILLLIRTITGNDFAGYKPNTIRRRIERRMALHQISRIEDYYRYAEQQSAEVEVLFKDLLIGVTNFFRDPGAFDALAKKILPGIVKNRTLQRPVRMWVPGCATGEEAYSLAIVLVETMEKHKVHVDVQIFATDIDEDAIAFARQGIFPDNISADVSKSRLRRFFIKSADSYAVNKQIRDMIVFANQNLINDPPFSKLDLVSCRNLLIYMKTELQKQILPLFHFTLVSDGTLFLGNSESIGGFADLFTVIDSKWKLFKRKEVLLEDMGEYPVPPLVQNNGPYKVPGDNLTPKMLNSRSIAEKLILEHYAPASVLVNESYDILYFMGDTSCYLSPPVGEPVVNLMQMIRKELRYKLSLALSTAVKRKNQIVTEGIELPIADSIAIIKITVSPFSEPAVPPGLMMVVFENQSAQAPADKPLKEKSVEDRSHEMDPQIENLKQELKFTRENLQTTIEELETSNEELKSTNEELQSTNEELQSTNEELETSKEEMHSTNEELVTINAELQNKVKELEGVNNDINNLLASTEIATIFLDNDLYIKRFTPAAVDLFNLISGDIGRPIGDITSKVNYDGLQSDAKQVLEQLVPLSKELQTKKGDWVSLKILPYRTLDNFIDGVVATFMDITDLKRMEEQASRLAVAVNNSADAITIQDFKGRITYWNKGATKMYGYSAAEAHKLNLCEIVPQDKQAELLEFVKVLKSGETLNTFETQRKTRDGKIVDVSLAATAVIDASGKPIGFTTTERWIRVCEGE